MESGTVTVENDAMSIHKFGLFFSVAYRVSWLASGRQDPNWSFGFSDPICYIAPLCLGQSGS